MADPQDLVAMNTDSFFIFFICFVYNKIFWTAPKGINTFTGWQAGFRIRITTMRIWLQPFTFMRIRIQLFILIQIRIRILIKVIGICGHWSIDLPGLHFKPSGFLGERPRLFFELLKLLNFDFNADLDPIFPFITDSDPASKNNADADLDPQPCWQDAYFQGSV
jgi:hypothetical protein